jgi:hypothetical protein
MAIPLPLRQALDDVMGKSGHETEVGDFARRLRPLLEAAVEELSAASVTRPSRRGTGEVGYVVEKTQQGEVLTENRPGRKSKPFRCPKLVYETLVAVLAGADRPLGMDEIMAVVEAKTGDRPADHQVRVALRFWMHVQPPQLARARARYRVVSREGFPSQAGRLWRQVQS